MASLLHKRIPSSVAWTVITAVLVIGFWIKSKEARHGISAAMGTALVSALVKYGGEHAGNLPASIRAADFQPFFCRSDLSAPRREALLAKFEQYYDVAWGTKPSEVDEAGFVFCRKRYLFEPVNHPVSIDSCKRLSRVLAESMRTHATTSSRAE